MCMISIGLTARTEEKAADTAVGAIANAEEAMDIATTMEPPGFRDQDREEATTEADEAIKNPAKGNAMSADDKDAGQSIILGRNRDDLLITSANSTTSPRARQPRHRTSRCFLVTLKERRRKD